MFNVRILSQDQLYDLFVDHSKRDPYKKIDKLCKEIKYLHFDWYNHNCENIFVCIFYNDCLCGVSKIKTGGCDSLSYPGWNNWIAFISVREGWFGQGLGKRLVEETFKYAKEKSIKLLMSGYSVRGWHHLRPHIHECSKKYEVEILDNATAPTFIDWEKFEGYESEEIYRKLF